MSPPLCAIRPAARSPVLPAHHRTNEVTAGATCAHCRGRGGRSPRRRATAWYRRCRNTDPGGLPCARAQQPRSFARNLLSCGEGI